jgi:hypothetical protein
MSQFSVNKKQEGDKLIVSFHGHIDEDASFSSIDLSGSKTIIIDLEKVSAINSVGIREWIKWIRSAPEGSRITYKNCTKVIVDQINMVSGFLPDSAEVESFYVPYYSEASGVEKMVLFQRGIHFDKGKVLPPQEVKDDASGDPMEMDVIEAKYFKFIHK